VSLLLTFQASRADPKEMPEFPDSEAVLAQFNRLMKELFDGNSRRNAFQPWEIDILLNIESCDLSTASKRDVLRRYQNAVQRQMEKGARLPLKLSEYLESLKTKRTKRNPLPSNARLMSHLRSH
jgi:hypothetical protein